MWQSSLTPDDTRAEVYESIVLLVLDVHLADVVVRERFDHIATIGIETEVLSGDLARPPARGRATRIARASFDAAPRHSAYRRCRRFKEAAELDVILASSTQIQRAARRIGPCSLILL